MHEDVAEIVVDVWRLAGLLEHLKCKSLEEPYGVKDIKSFLGFPWSHTRRQDKPP